ncbi:hypothetical protein [Candidatus Enterococcus ferrettii]|uniref:Uncharacterized protein n=1 Tax=Candidatus Enterococcus ferrettii TaxID=2815324 RepID=A0ABV0EKQ5_9ENTE|nr:hypothetical protein [Enterococcus sp. 665A]MBO1340932.1 hypothetical protein [Enterococcus sp. 665A]
MSKYIEHLTIGVSPQTAWEALKEMNTWLSSLSTNKAVIYDDDKNFFVEGRDYRVQTKEGIVMDSQLFKIDSDNLTVEIHAKFFVLRSLLTCQVKPITDNTCEIIRTQKYLGTVGKVFTFFFNRRESGETSEYLNVWGRYANNLANQSEN